MRKFVIVALGLALIGPAPAARAATLEQPCSASLKSLTDDWDTIAFPIPSKPAQARVVGRYGVESSGGQVNYMRNQIRLAVRDCQAGREDSTYGGSASSAACFAKPAAMSGWVVLPSGRRTKF
jgi:hypothetical protein